MYDYVKQTEKDFQRNVYMSHVGTNDLPTDMTPEEISEKLLLFLNIGKQKIFVSDIVPRDDYLK